MPHIEAKQERDAYAALGFCMAEDRLFQLDLLRRLAMGRSAEVLGPDFARADALVRTAGVARRAAAAATRLKGEAREALAAFVGGLNAVAAERRCPEAEALGYRLQPWTLADCLALELYAAWGLGMAGWAAKLALGRALASAGQERVEWLTGEPLPTGLVEPERLALLRRIDPRLVDLMAAPELGGGYAWAVAAEAEAPGAVVAAAPTLPATLPPLGYLVHMEAGALSVAGAALAGTPIVVAGRNRRCAWAATGLSLDDADWVLEDLDGIGNFRTPRGWEKLAHRREVVRVRGGADLLFEVLETRNGPLLSHLLEQVEGPWRTEARAVPIALRWGVNSLGSSLGGWLALARAESIDDVASAARRLERGPAAMGLVAGDASGRVARWLVGVLPHRDGAARLPVRGWADEAGWKGTVPLSARSYEAPVSGVALAPEAAGARAHGGGAPSPLGGSGAPAWAVPGLRSALEGRPPLAEHWDLLCADPADPVAAEIGRLVAAVAAADPELSDLARGLSAEGDERRRAGAVLAAALRDHLLPEILPEERFAGLARPWARPSRLIARVLAAPSSPWFRDEASRDDAVRRALRAAQEAAVRASGPDPTEGPLGFRGIVLASPGACETERSAWPSAGAGISLGPEGPPAPWRRDGSVLAAPGLRVATEVGTSLLLRAVLPGGQQGRPGTPHFAEQLALWSSGGAVELELGRAPEGEIVELVGG